MPTVTSSQVVAPEAPRQLGEWRLLRPLSMNTRFQVYQAAPLSSHGGAADYVVKTPCVEGAEDATSLEMLRREVIVSNSVSHPNLATVLAAELEQVPYYIVTPFMVGASLRSAIDQRGRLPTPHALWIARQIAAALAALHAAGWLHADVKPANIFLAASGHATLIDLGIACRWPVRRGGNYFAGTVNYAAPEWFTTSCAPGPASDIFGLGAVLFELLTGRVWAEAAGRGEAQAGRGFCDPRQLVPSISLNIVGLLRRLLATEPLRRPSAAELVEQLVALEIETIEERA